MPTYPKACRYCRARIFLYLTPYGFYVPFDQLAPPWPKHDCPAWKHRAALLTPAEQLPQPSRVQDSRERMTMPALSEEDMLDAETMLDFITACTAQDAQNVLDELQEELDARRAIEDDLKATLDRGDPRELAEYPSIHDELSEARWLRLQTECLLFRLCSLPPRFALVV